jgi:allophanate hydrolase subunit 1
MQFPLTMTKVQIHLGLQRPLDDETMKRIRDANSIYGIERIKILPSLTELMVEYDATRLKPAEVERALAQAGIAAR